MKGRFFSYFCFLNFLVLLLVSEQVQSQAGDISYAKSGLDYDTTYIKAFPDHITTRLYMSRKFTSIRFDDEEEEFPIDYQPNTTLNLGIGATANGFTLNLAYGFAFLNQDESRGKTQYLDLQSHIYGRKFAIDAFGQFYKGMFLNNTSSLFDDYPVNHYLRPDIGIVVIGANYLRVFNDKKFSYAAPFVQNEWQKKSAGSFLLGGKLMLMAAGADSSMIPSHDRDSLYSEFDGLTNLSSFQFGPSVGYAHTFVMWHHVFFTVSLDLNFMISSVRYEREDLDPVQEMQLNTSVDVKVGLGYNSENSYFGLTYVEDENKLRSENDQVLTDFSIGNIRLNYVKRFRMGDKLKQVLDKYLP